MPETKPPTPTPRWLKVGANIVTAAVVLLIIVFLALFLGVGFTPEIRVISQFFGR